jgi:uncharacterized membrane protein
MENVSDISSEEELLELRNEGKISEDEYGELLETLRKSVKIDAGPAGSDESKPVRTSGLAIASLALSILSAVIGPLGCIPGIVCGHIARRQIKKDPAIQGAGIATAGLIIGYIFLVLFVIVVFMFSQSHSRLRARIRDVEARWSEIRRGEIHRESARVQIELKRFPVDTMEGIIAQAGVEIDKQISSDSNGSLRITASEATVVRLFEIRLSGAHLVTYMKGTRLIYQAKLRTENVEGQVYLEMWCHFPGKGDFFSRGLMTPLTGTTDWTTQETPFLLKKGENPDNVKLNLVIDGKGTAWIDDIRLLKGTLW